jgi:hypothetical protein
MTTAALTSRRPAVTSQFVHNSADAEIPGMVGKAAEHPNARAGFSPREMTTAS